MLERERERTEGECERVVVWKKTLGGERESDTRKKKSEHTSLNARKNCVFESRWKERSRRRRTAS